MKSLLNSTKLSPTNDGVGEQRAKDWDFHTEKNEEKFSRVLKLSFQKNLLDQLFNIFRLVKFRENF